MSHLPQNQVAAFQITGAGLADFNGIYLPTLKQKDSDACTPIVWEMRAANVTNLLYYDNGHWILGCIGKNASYSGADSGACMADDETMSWVAVAENAGDASTIKIARLPKAAAEYNHAGNRESFNVSCAGLPEFNGVYYMADDVVVTQRCQRTFAKDGPTNTKYTLFFEDTLWWFASDVGTANEHKPYFGTDRNYDCAPESVIWVAIPPPLL